MRIGEVARATGVTARTIRYYEEIGLLPAADERSAGAHRIYTEDDVARLRDVLRLKDLLGVTLDELKTVVEDETVRAALRAEFPGADVGRRVEILDEAEVLLERQTALLERRRAQLDELAADLAERRERIALRRAELPAPVR